METSTIRRSRNLLRNKDLIMKSPDPQEEEAIILVAGIAEIKGPMTT